METEPATAYTEILLPPEALPPPDGAAGMALPERLQAMAHHALDLIVMGGPVVALLAALSVISLALILVKLWQFRRARLGQGALAGRMARLARDGRATDARRLGARSRNPAVHLVDAAICGRAAGLPEEALREELGRLGGEDLESLRSYLRPLELIGAIAPLLGLLGTVLGMIEAFQALEQSGNAVDPAILSGGIWEALLTTAVGLAVAIPAVVAVNLFDRAIQRTAHHMESAVGAVLAPHLDMNMDIDAAPRPRRNRPAMRLDAQANAPVAAE